MDYKQYHKPVKYYSETESVEQELFS